MYLPQNDISEIVLRQYNQREELSKALAKNQAKVTRLQQQIRFLELPLYSDYDDECERLDQEILKLRRACQDMSNEIEVIKQANEAAAAQRQPLRPAPPPPPHPPPRTRPHNLFGRFRSHSAKSPVSPQTPPSQQGQSPASPSNTVEQEQAQANGLDENDTSDEEQRWPCSMCTMLNHPSLNKCEMCGNVRILPGSVRIVPSRPPPPLPASIAGTRSAPQTPGIPSMMPPLSGSQSARVLTRMPSEFGQSHAVVTSSSEGNLQQFAGDVVL